MLNFDFLKEEEGGEVWNRNIGQKWVNLAFL